MWIWCIWYIWYIYIYIYTIYIYIYIYIPVNPLTRVKTNISKTFLVARLSIDRPPGSQVGRLIGLGPALIPVDGIIPTAAPGPCWAFQFINRFFFQKSTREPERKQAGSSSPNVYKQVPRAQT